MPNVVILAGPNGAGKSTAAEALIRDLLGIKVLVSAEAIAQGLAGFDPESAMESAWRHKMRRLDQLVEREADFAFETTLAGYDFAPWLQDVRGRDYRIEIVYVWVPDVEVCVARVFARARAGHQRVSEETTRRQHGESAQNFFGLYQPLADGWRVFDNSSDAGARLVAEGRRSMVTAIHDSDVWNSFVQRAGYERES